MGQSLAASTGSLTKDLQLPAIFTQGQAPLEARKIAPYVVYVHPARRDEWNKLLMKFGPAVKEGDLYLFEPDAITPLGNAKLGLVCAQQYWVLVDAVGNITKASFEQLPDPWKEHVEAVVVVYLADRMVPANMSFRTTKCGAVKSLTDALIAAGSPAWANGGPAYEATMQITQPWLRFHGILVNTQRTSKKTGAAYIAASAGIFPTSKVEAELIGKFAESEGAQHALEEAARRFTERVAEMRTKV